MEKTRTCLTVLVSIIISTQYSPHTNIRRGPNGEYLLNGTVGNVFNALVQALHFNYTIALPPEVTTGSPRADGSWTGCMGMLHRNESDLAMGPFFPASERLEIAKPSTVFYMEQLRILAGRESSQQSSVFGYIMAFDWMASILNLVLRRVAFLNETLSKPFKKQRRNLLEEELNVCSAQSGGWPH
ncbi:putative glutamate receptor [Rhipicephalus microplus]|uniref:putative glutamate receptor n=1 Tax=Rhipicephalus microplus TaxID=6941 RepID=UPI003F6BAB45